MPARDDETVRIRGGTAAIRPSRRVFLGCAVCAGLAAVGGTAWMVSQSHTKPAAPPAPEPPPKPRIAIRTAGESAIASNHAADLDVFRFDHNPSILILDFASLARQGAMLNRIAAMAEKNGQPHDRALDDADLDRAIRAGGDTPETFYYGHDYGTIELGRFFAATDHQNLALQPDEQWLRGLVAQEEADRKGPIGLISIPAVGGGGVTMDMRRTILHHELSHGEFFTNPAYADWTHTFWSGVLDAGDRDAFRTFLVSENYDPGLETLLANETQAYLMFTPSQHFFRPELVNMDPAGIAALREKFRRGMPPGWLRDMAMQEATL